ncbi:MAG: penicillin-binding protein activator LpoB [Spirochaetales bacterium]|jgi:uncharacterized protein (TIGR02722 family)|nr:penicillin-binding protein activator LpoB [Spirochaetales bacterium]
MRKFFVLYALLCAALCFSACSSAKTVTRMAADAETDLSGRWNDTDARLVAEAMISDVMQRPWISDFTGEEGRKPVVIVGDIRNRSREHIETLVFTKSLERELINSGKVKFVANEAERESVREERMNQQSEASPETMKRLGQETGADFCLQGLITSQTDRVEGQMVVFYKINLELIHMETNEKVWIGDKEIKKLIEQSRFRA